MQLDKHRRLWDDRVEAILPVAGALFALGILLMILVV